MILAGLMMIFAMFVIAGCGSDDRVVAISREAADRQAQQNTEMARVVDDETAVRHQVAKLQNDLRDDQAKIAKQRDELEAERQLIASRREWAEFLTPLLETVGIVAVVIAVLVYCGSILANGFRHDSHDHEVAEMLVADITAERPVLLPAAPTEDLPRLPAPASHAGQSAPVT